MFCRLAISLHICCTKPMALLIPEEKVLTCVVWLHLWNLASKGNSAAILPPKEKDHNKAEDRISKLPDDIILIILSHLGMKDAARTCILSKCWRSIWSNLPYLDFDYLIVIPQYFDVEVFPGPKPKLSTKYINWVNQVVKLHSWPSLDKFRTQFWFSESDKHHIDRWVKFALSKRVKNLQLKLYSLTHNRTRCIYTLGFDILKPSLLDSVISSLRCLVLDNVGVSGEFLEFLLSECHLLERLVLKHCGDSLIKLKVASDKLKQLKIYCCFSLDEIEIHAVNLTRLDYFGHDASIEYKCVPAITEASLGGLCCTASVPICEQIACFSMQLSKLSLDLSFVEDPLIWDPSTLYYLPIEGYPCFSNLRRLAVCLRIEMNLPGVASLLEACPVAREIKFELFWNDIEMREDEIKNEYFANVSQKNDCENKMPRTEYKALPNLRTVEVVGFKGCSDDVNLLIHILKIGTELQSLICHLFGENFPIKDEFQEVRSRAHKLSTILSSKLNFVIM